MVGPVTLAGDIGGTKAYLGIFRSEGDGLCCLAEGHFVTTRYSGVSELLASFVETSGQRPEKIVVGVPGAVRHPPVKPVNLPWTIDPVEIGDRLGIADVHLLNDLEATAYGTLVLPPDDLIELNRGTPDDEGNIAVIAAGTGLGEGGLCWTGERFISIPSEGGHASFAPGTDLESELWAYLFERFGHVSWERVVSGPGLVHIYEFFRSADHGQESAWLGRELAAAEDRPGAISRAAARGDELASRALDLFVSLYGAEAGNLGLKLMSTGGVFVGGGIAPKIADKLRQGSFMKGFTEKGRVADVLEALPVHIILNDKTALLGAAHFGVHLGSQGKRREAKGSMKRRVKEILSWYGSDNPGTLTNLARILNSGRLGGTGRLIILPVDQGVEHGPGRSFAPNPAAYDPRYHFELAIEAGLNAYAAPLGFLEAGARDYAGDLPLILKLNNRENLSSDKDPLQAVTGSIEAALRLGCVAIGYTVYPGSALRTDMYERLQELAEEAKRHGLVVVVWSYPRGSDISKDGETALDVSAYAAQIAAQLGAHIIKVKPPGPHVEQDEARKAYDNAGLATGALAERIQHVVQSSFNGRRIVIFSGGAAKGKEEIFEEIRGIRDGGGFGSIMGRNAFQRERTEALELLGDVIRIYQGKL